MKFQNRAVNINNKVDTGTPEDNKGTQSRNKKAG